MNLHVDSSRSFLKSWLSCLGSPFSSYTEDPVPETWYSEVIWHVVHEVSRAMVAVEMDATCEVILCHSCPPRHFELHPIPPVYRSEMVPHVGSSCWADECTRMDSAALCPPGLEAMIIDQGCPLRPDICCPLSLMLLPVGWRSGWTLLKQTLGSFPERR